MESGSLLEHDMLFNGLDNWTVVATPEPSSIFLLCPGLLGVLGVRREIAHSF
jgi:hypothetical protein